MCHNLKIVNCIHLLKRHKGPFIHNTGRKIAFCFALSREEDVGHGGKVTKMSQQKMPVQMVYRHQVHHRQIKTKEWLKIVHR